MALLSLKAFVAEMEDVLQAEQVLPSDSSVCVCGAGGFDLCAMISQCSTGVQPHPSPEA